MKCNLKWFFRDINVSFFISPLPTIRPCLTSDHKTWNRIKILSLFEFFYIFISRRYFMLAFIITFFYSFEWEDSWRQIHFTLSLFLNMRSKNRKNLKLKSSKIWIQLVPIVVFFVIKIVCFSFSNFSLLLLYLIFFCRGFCVRVSHHTMRWKFL